MRRTFAVALKELRQIGRDPLSLVMLLGVPAFMLVLFGYAVSFDVEHLRLGVEDRDRSVASRSLLDAFVQSRRFDVAAVVEPGDGLAPLFERRRAQLVLVVPAGFERRMARGEEAPLQLVVDGADATTATTALGYAEGVVDAWNRERLAAAVRRRGRAVLSPFDLRPRVWYNPELRSSAFLVPGLIGFILMITAVLSTALSLVREKERGTLEQLRVSPLAAPQILVGKILPYLAVSLAATGIILVAARLLFGVAVRGSLTELLAVTLLYLVGAFGFGLLISTIADSQALAFQMGVFASVLPTLILSGFIFPIRNMPPILQLLSTIVPARYYLVVLRGIVVKGSDAALYLDQLGALALYSLVVLAVASVRWARKEA